MEENIVVSFCDLGWGNGFLYMTTKEEADKLDFIKIKKKKIVLPKSIKKMKKQPSDWENIFVSYISDKRLVSKILQLNDKNK